METTIPTLVSKKTDYFNRHINLKQGTFSLLENKK